MSGPARAWFLLAYDVWVLALYRFLYPTPGVTGHKGVLYPIISRMKNDPPLFQGARYELTTYALFLRSGFIANPIEQTVSKGRTVEFLGRHRESGEQLAVEAKGRQRPGVLGFPALGHKIDKDPEPKIRDRLLDALGKKPAMPYVVGIELSLPPSFTREHADAKIKSAPIEIEQLVAEYELSEEKFPANLIVLTNYPDHYGTTHEPAPPGYQAIIEVPRPLYPFMHEDTLERVRRRLLTYGNISRNLGRIRSIPLTADACR